MRLFVAIELPAETRAEVARATAPLRDLDDALRWSRAETLHVTLAFLGTMEESRVGELTAALEGAAAAVAPFELTIRGVGGFPGLRRPRVVWAGVDAPAELGRLHQRVEAALAPRGYTAERRPFAPHLTLARVRGGRARPIPALEEAAGGVELETTLLVREIALMQSLLGAGGARYARVAAVPLGGR